MIPDRLEPVLAELRPLADRFVAAGHSVYLVGGTVRDLLLGRPIVGDYDLTTDARPPEIKRLLADWADAIWTQGERFGTIGARRGDRSYEITTHRAEAYHADSRKPDVAFADAIESDLSRRDFTVNAMALALPDPHLIDPFDGAADLAAGRLRTPLSAAESFTDDPLRMLRAARFLAGYDLHPVEGLADAIRDSEGPPRDRVGRAHPRRARQAADGRPSERGPLVARGDRPVRRVPARAFGDASRAGSDPSTQGRPRPHDRRRRERDA